MQHIILLLLVLGLIALALTLTAIIKKSGRTKTFLPALRLYEMEYIMTNKKLNLQCNGLFHAVKPVIDEWNPYGLLPDAPSNEFDGESKSIAAEIREGDSIEKIAKIVSHVFSQQFEPDYFGVASCMDVAEKIKKNIDSI